MHVQVLSTFSVGDLDGILEDSIYFPPAPTPNDDSLQERSLPLNWLQHRCCVVTLGDGTHEKLVVSKFVISTQTTTNDNEPAGDGGFPAQPHSRLAP